MRLLLNSLILTAIAWPGFCQSKPVAVDVYVNANDDSAQLLGRGKSMASSIFKKIGVQVNWRAGELGKVPNPAQNAAYGIRTLECAPQSATPGALAAARIVGSAGTEIAVYKDRVQRFVENHANLAGVAVGYVLAHELAHVMQGVPRHSEAGILRAQWSNNDYQEMIFQKLAFTALDVDLIRKGLDTQVASRRNAAAGAENAEPAAALPGK